jgi:hypothetical protein
MNFTKENEDGSVTSSITYSKERAERVLYGYGIKDSLDEMEGLVKAWFITTGFEVKDVFRLSNQYWGYSLDDCHYRVANPWWLVETDVGKIVLGPRKRVWHIDWERTTIRGIVTEEDITKGDTYVHSYSHADTVKYLASLRKIYDKSVTDAIRAKRDEERAAEQDEP